MKWFHSDQIQDILRRFQRLEEPDCFDGETEGEICSGHGNCLHGECKCDLLWDGVYCQNELVGWNEVVAKNEAPAPREQHSAVMYQDYMWVFGSPSTDIWKYDFSSSTWDQISIPGMSQDRIGHSAVVYLDAMWIFGGYRESTERFNDVWCFNFTEFSWEVVTSSDRPQERDQLSAVVYQDAMWIFGGKLSSTDRSNDTWKFSFRDSLWERVETNEEPPIRSAHSAVVYEDEMWVYGGWAGFSIPDFWKLDLDQQSWTLVSTINEDYARSSHSALVYNDEMWIFGGYQEPTGSQNNLLSYDFDENEWNYHDELGNAPSPRYDYSAVLYHDALWIFGGYGISSFSNNSVWVYIF